MSEPSLEIATGALIGLARILSRRPRWLMLTVAKVLGLVVYTLVARRRRVALSNLAIAFPELTPAARQAIAKTHIKAFVVSLIDRFALWEGPVQQIEQMVRVSGWSHLASACEAGPVIVLAPHFLGLDAGGLYLSSRLPVVSVYAQQKKPKADRRYDFRTRAISRYQFGFAQRRLARGVAPFEAGQSSIPAA